RWYPTHLPVHPVVLFYGGAAAPFSTVLHTAPVFPYTPCIGTVPGFPFFFPGCFPLHTLSRYNGSCCLLTYAAAFYNAVSALLFQKRALQSCRAVKQNQASPLYV